MNSLVPAIVNSKRIRFFDERDIERELCKKTDSVYKNPFVKPYLIVDKFAKKSTEVTKTCNLEFEELIKLDKIITVTKITPGMGYFKRQQVVYQIEDKTNRSPGSRKLGYIPSDHKVVKDVINKRIRIVGTNAGYPNYNTQWGNAGPWIEIK